LYLASIENLTHEISYRQPPISPPPTETNPAGNAAISGVLSACGNLVEVCGERLSAAELDAVLSCVTGCALGGGAAQGPRTPRVHQGKTVPRAPSPGMAAMSCVDKDEREWGFVWLYGMLILFFLLLISFLCSNFHTVASSQPETHRRRLRFRCRRCRAARRQRETGLCDARRSIRSRCFRCSSLSGCSPAPARLVSFCFFYKIYIYSMQLTDRNISIDTPSPPNRSLNRCSSCDSTR
jgi:hypothetical protein